MGMPKSHILYPQPKDAGSVRAFSWSWLNIWKHRLLLYKGITLKNYKFQCSEWCCCDREDTEAHQQLCTKKRVGSCVSQSNAVRLWHLCAFVSGTAPQIILQQQIWLSSSPILSSRKPSCSSWTQEVHFLSDIGSSEEIWTEILIKNKSL